MADSDCKEMVESLIDKAIERANSLVKDGVTKGSACLVAVGGIFSSAIYGGDLPAWEALRWVEEQGASLGYVTEALRKVVAMVAVEKVKPYVSDSAKVDVDGFLRSLGTAMPEFALENDLNSEYVRRSIKVEGDRAEVSWKLAMPDGVRFGAYPGCIEFYRVDCDLQEFPREACDPDLPYGTVDRYLVAWAVDDAYAWGLEHGTKRFGECLVGSDYADKDEGDAETTYRNLKEYAETHGYDFQYENQS